jgi:UDP-2-acetamido-3-amino-2,3-dideoxy-glucuronate N-acetyltransferase
VPSGRAARPEAASSVAPIALLSVAPCVLASERASHPDDERRSAKPALPAEPANDAPFRLIAGVEFGEDVQVFSFTNLYGCRIGDGTRIGPFVEIQRGAVVGARCKIQSHTFICDGVEIEDEVFVGHGVMFINDKAPRATTESGELQTDADWELVGTVVERRASLGSGAVILGGIRIGAGALIGAGAVVTKDVPAGATVAGSPARALHRSH